MTGSDCRHEGQLLYFLTAPNGQVVGLNYRDQWEARAASERTGDPITRQCTGCGALLPGADDERW